jgi:hypothetical protein
VLRVRQTIQTDEIEDDRASAPRGKPLARTETGMTIPQQTIGGVTAWGTIRTFLKVGT